MKKKLIVTIISLLAIIGCSDETDELLVSSEGPPAFPHVFMGNAYVNGQPIEEGVIIYAEFGKSKSEIVETLFGRYLNVLVAPRYKSELDAEVNFYIENKNGNKEKAIENFKLSNVSEPNVVNMNLNFKKYP